MSVDRSLKGKSTLERHRNVLTRAERVERLKEYGRWNEDSTAIGLPKIAHRKAAVGKKDKVEKQDEEQTPTTEQSENEKENEKEKEKK